MKKQKNNQFILIIFLFSIFLILINLIFVYKKNQDIRLKAQTAGLSLILTPKEYIFEAGQEKEAILTLNNPLGKKIVGVNLGIRYNPNVIQPQTISVNAGSDKSFTDNFSPAVNNQGGEARIVLFANKEDANLPTANSILLAIIKFKAVNGGKSDIFIDQNYEIIGFSSPNDDYKQTLANFSLGTWQVPGPSVTLEPTHPITTPAQPTITITLTPTPIPKGEVNLNIRLKFQGVVKKPEKATSQPNVKIFLQSQWLNEPKEKIISLTVKNQALWEGNADFADIPLVSEKAYQVKINVPKHLETKIENLLLTEGKNDLDLTDHYILAGDINNDNLINAYDLSFIRNNLNSKNSETINRGDLNFDQTLNASDFSLAISSLTILSQE